MKDILIGCAVEKRFSSGLTEEGIIVGIKENSNCVRVLLKDGQIRVWEVFDFNISEQDRKKIFEATKKSFDRGLKEIVSRFEIMDLEK